MSDQITYDDKVDLQVATNIANINKVTASDMNEIKNVVNNNADDIDVANNNITQLHNNKLDIADVLNQASTDTDKPYSADYLNDKLVSVGTTAPTDGRRVWFKESKNVLVPNFNNDYTNTKTGITLTYNNGTYRVQGTATSDYFFTIADQNQKDLRAKLLSGKYYLSGAPSGSSNSTYWLQIYGISATGTSVVQTFEEGLRINNFVNEAQNFNISIFVKANQTIDILFKPQLEEGEKTSFEPYIEPSINVDGEKWVDKVSDTGWVNISSYVNTSNFAIRTNDTIKARRIGNIVYFKGEIYCKTALNNHSGTIMYGIPSIFRPTTQYSRCGVKYDLGVPYNIFIATNGNIVVSESQNISVTPDYKGYQLTNLSGYIVD